MNLLHRLITTRMENDDVIAHLDRLHLIFERLDSLVTPDTPLTVDEILTTSIFTSLPQDWLPVVTPLMQRTSVTASTVIRAIKNEVTRCKTSSDLSADAVAAKAHAARPSHSNYRPAGRNNKFCLYCKRRNHNVDNCWAKEADEAHSSSKKGGRPSSSNLARPSTKAGKTSVVTLEFSDDDASTQDDDVVKATSAEVMCSSAVSNFDWNVDSGCSLSMTPFPSSLSNLQTSKKIIQLADSSSIKATHSGQTLLPLCDVDHPHRSLLVPSLQEPLLPVASLCDDGFVVVFDKDSCSFHRSGDSSLPPSSLTKGYCRGNLYYLPAKVDTSHSHLTRLKDPDMSLLHWHRNLGHIGLKPLKALLCSSGISPPVMNEIDVQRCPTCVESKMARHSFHSRSLYRSSSPGDLIHSDVCSFEVSSREGFWYFVTFIDD